MNIIEYSLISGYLASLSMNKEHPSEESGETVVYEQITKEFDNYLKKHRTLQRQYASTTSGKGKDIRPLEKYAYLVANDDVKESLKHMTKNDKNKIMQMADSLRNRFLSMRKTIRKQPEVDNEQMRFGATKKLLKSHDRSTKANKQGNLERFKGMRN